MSEECQINGGRVFPSLQTLAEHMGIPKGLLSIAKRKGAPGFTVSGRIYLDQLEPWLKEHMQELEDEHDDNLTQWKTRKTKAEALTAELELEEMKERYLDKEEVSAFLKQVATAQRALLKAKLCNELPPKLLGLGIVEMGVIMDQTVQDICNLFQASQWIKDNE